MRHIKLLTLTSLSYFVIFALLLTVTFTVFFKFLKVGVNESIDELLASREKTLITLLKKTNAELPKASASFTDYDIKVLNAVEEDYTIYTDTLIYDKDDKENYLYRKSSSVHQIRNKYYKIDVLLPLIEEEDVIYSLIKALVLVFFIVLSMFYLSSRFLSKRIFTSFYNTLDRLKDFEVQKKSSFLPVHSKIQEFSDLNISLSELTSKAHEAFFNQKKFIENASHELQTPIAVNQNKLEELAGDLNLTDKQSQVIQVLINVNQRMSRLNKTLLLLSKIENGHYPETETILIKPLIEDILVLFEEQKLKNSIRLILLIEEDVLVTGNFVLLELLLTNLIKNAFVHNYKGGEIIIDFSDGRLRISNTSHTAEIPQTDLYKRFYKNSTRKESWGLGLAIVKNICVVQNWDIHYLYVMNGHTFQLSFNHVK